MKYIDSHTHVCYEDLDKYEIDLEIARKEGISEILLILTNEKERLDHDRFKSDLVKLAYGIYPSGDTEIDYKKLNELEELMKDDYYLALGEIGLDYYWYKDNKEVQKELFKLQLDIADRCNKPIIVHCRDAMGDLYEILKERPNKKRGVIHSFSGSKEMALALTKLGYYLSFNGVLTFKNAKNVKESILTIDKQYLLFETDAPYLTPEPMRGKMNHTYYVKLVYEYAAKLLNMDLDELCLQVSKNYRRLFYAEN